MITMLKDLLNMDVILEQPRYAGGHEEIMTVLFKDAIVIASWIEQAYQGDEFFTYKLGDGRYVLVSDYFGSCSGCDVYENASSDEIKHLVTELANNAKIFTTLDELIEYCKAEKHAEDYAFSGCNVLLEQLNEYKEKK